MPAHRRTLKVASAIGLLLALYWYCDWRLVAAAVVGLDRVYLSWAVLLFVPQTLVSARRWQLLAASRCCLTLREAVRQTLAASAWNLAAPSKLGDFSKAAMLPLEGAAARKSAVGLVCLEKAADVGALLFLWFCGAAWSYRSGWMISASMLGVVLAGLSTQYSVLSTPRSTLRSLTLPARLSALRILSASLALWVLHLGQIHLMLLAAGVNVDFGISLARIPAAIFAGLLPVSFCGIGTRDGALIWLFSDVASPGTMAAVGLLTATRYLVPGAIGIPLLWKRSC
jgi:hypothetical protein